MITTSDDEIDLIEKRIDTSEDEANSSFDKQEGEDSILTSSPKSSTVEMLNLDSRNKVYGKETKTKSSKSIPPFQWFDSADSFYCGETNKYDSKIIEELKEEKSMHIFFKNIITDEMITLIVEYTNLRISRIDTSEILNKVYRKQFERLIIELKINRLCATMSNAFAKSKNMISIGYPSSIACVKRSIVSNKFAIQFFLGINPC
jgi:hypothetical protein